MKTHYIRVMDALHRACVFAAGACLVVITLIIPYGVFCRYVLNSAASWPEPMAVLLMIVMSFLSAVVCYREYLHIGVGVLPAFLKHRGEDLSRLVSGTAACSPPTCSCWCGASSSCGATLEPEHRRIFRRLASVCLICLISIGGGLTVLFIIEQLITQKFFAEPEAETVSGLTTE